ncbi:type I-E CRISPR-associated protein Cas6/Cse3/CasE [Bifidobacterium pseudocatenulatum]|nr:type I-E CRISPR-associated protein Cas6/Cse3/CasE [Bifidobacterium pseudocatenulatum]MCH4858819.1 type I-E CRISPR-associated protein Cas6/Cse3/CasE [Bifidobacterium pseudocatenulatum]
MVFWWSSIGIFVCLCQGIGRAKGFGCGLLTIAPDLNN